MAFTDHVKVMFGADTTDFNKELENAETKTKNFAKTFGKFFVGALGTAALVKTTKDVVGFAAEIDNMSRRLGASTDFLQGLQYGAEQAGVSANSATIAFQRFSRRTQEAKERAGPLRDALESLGIKFEDTNGIMRTTEDIFTEFGEKLSAMDDPARKIRIAFTMLDTEGVALNQMFQKGSKNVKQYIDEARRLGVLMEKSTITTLREADDTLAKLGRQMKVTFAEFLPPFIKQLQKVGKALSGGMKIIKDYASEIMLLVGAIGAYKIASVAFTAVGPIIKGLQAMAGTVGILTTKIKALNAVQKANVFGIFVVGVLSAVTALKKFSVYLDRAKREMEEWKDRTATDTNEKMSTLSATLDELNNKLKALNDELKKGEDPYSDMSLEKQVEVFKNLSKEGQKLNKELEYQQELHSEIIADYDKQIQKAKESGNSETYINSILAKRKASIVELTRAEVGLAQNKLEMQKNTERLVEAEKKLVDQQYAQANNLTHLLDSQNDQERSLRRQNELVKALQNGGLELHSQIKQNHAVEDQIIKLRKDGNLSLEEAREIALNLVKTTAQEEVLLNNIKTIKEENVKKTEEERKLAEQKRAEIEKEIELQSIAREESRKQLIILKLMAEGKMEQARVAQNRMDSEKEIKRLMMEQGLSLDDAVAKVRERLRLEGKISADAVQRNLDAIKQGALDEMLSKRRIDLHTKEELKRHTAARNIKAIEEEIQRLIASGKDISDEKIRELEAAKEAKFQILLTDDAKRDIENLSKEKQEIINNFQEEVKGLAQAKSDVDKSIATAITEAEAKRLEIEQAGKESLAKQKELNDATISAITDLKDSAVKAFDRVGKPEIVVNVSPMMPESKTTDKMELPPITNEITVKVENELKQITQEEILQTLRGYFTNQ